MKYLGTQLTGVGTATGANDIGVSGYFPEISHPVVRVYGAAVGNNDLYTVPTGRKALFIDYWVTNPTAGTIISYPALKIGSTYYRISPNTSESAAGIGHNIGLTGASRGVPIVMNAGETIAVNCDVAGDLIWAKVIEFSSVSPLARADIRDGAWVNGNNTLFTMPSNVTVTTGIQAFNSSNNPNIIETGLCYVNGSGATVAWGGIFVVPSGGSYAANSGTAFGGTQTIFNAGSFSKFLPGNLATGDTIVLQSNSAANGQYAWMNYASF